LIGRKALLDGLLDETCLLARFGFSCKKGSFMEKRLFFDAAYEIRLILQSRRAFRLF
jgi:hypothetical protein